MRRFRINPAKICCRKTRLAEVVYHQASHKKRGHVVSTYGLVLCLRLAETLGHMPEFDNYNSFIASLARPLFKLGQKVPPNICACHGLVPSCPLSSGYWPRVLLGFRGLGFTVWSFRLRL